MSKSTSTFGNMSSRSSSASSARTGEGRAERSHPGPVPAADTSVSPPRSDDPAETDLGKDMNTRRESAKDKSAKGKKERRQRVRDEKEQVKFIKDKREATMRAAGQEFWAGWPYPNVDTMRERGINMLDKLAKAMADWPYPEGAAEDDKDEPHLTDGAPAEHQRQ